MLRVIGSKKDTGRWFSTESYLIIKIKEELVVKEIISDIMIYDIPEGFKAIPAAVTIQPLGSILEAEPLHQGQKTRILG